MSSDMHTAWSRSPPPQPVSTLLPGLPCLPLGLVGHLALPDGRNRVGYKFPLCSTMRGFVLSHPPTCTPGTWSYSQLSPTLGGGQECGRERSQERTRREVWGYSQESQAVLSQAAQGGRGAQALLPVPRAPRSQGHPGTQVVMRGATTLAPPLLPHPGLQLTFCPLGPMTQISPGRPC